MDLDSLTILKEAVYLVRPRRLDISKRCSDITGLSRDDLRAAPPFNNVLDLLIQEFTPSQKLCCVWGDDADLLSEACGSRGMRSPLRNVVDLGQLFWRLFLLRQRPSVQGATEILGLRFDGVAHTALADARNTALIHAEILRRIRNQSGLIPAIADSPRQPERSTVLAEKLTSILKDLRF
jgi:inhibitor of KinA sporulation pathway (predicted exonuclease)